MAVCTFTLEQLRSELQRTVQAELQNLRHVVSEEMQKKFDQAGLACPRGDAGDRSCSNVKQHGEATAPAMLQCPGKAAAIAMPEVHALCDEAPARPAPELQRSANHGMMPGSDESERMLQLSDGHERKHTHHGSKKTFTPAGKAALQVNAHATTGSSTLFETLSHYAFLLIAHYAFDYASALLVILNATWIGYQTDYIATTWAETKPGYFKTGDNLFCLLAVIEVMIRMTAEGWDFFVGQGWRWNWFDLILAGSQVVDVASCILFPGGGQNEALRLLRVCKLVRIARIARIAAAFPQLHVLIASVVDSMSALFWTLLLICAFLFRSLYRDHTSCQRAQDGAWLGIYGGAPRIHFGILRKFAGHHAFFVHGHLRRHPLERAYGTTCRTCVTVYEDRFCSLRCFSALRDDERYHGNLR